MEIESYLTDVYGPRLTGSPNIKEAADWAQKTMKEWGLANVHLETLAVRPRLAEPALRRACADAARLPAHRLSESVDAGHQRPGHRRSGRWRSIHEREGLRHVPRQAARQVRARDGDARRAARSSRRPAVATPTPSSRTSRSSRRRGRARPRRTRPADAAFARKRTQFWIDEGVAAVLDISRGDGGTLFVQGGGSRDAEASAVSRRRSCSPSSTTAASRARSTRTFRSRCRWTSRTRSTTTT